MSPNSSAVSDHALWLQSESLYLHSKHVRGREFVQETNKKTVLLVDVFGRGNLHFVTSSKFADLAKLRHGTRCFLAPVFCGSNSNFITVIWAACEANMSAPRLHSDIKLNSDVRYDNTNVPRKLPPFGT